MGNVIQTQSGSAMSEALDIQELADHMDLGHMFYVIAVCMGTYSIWACLKYIPHRLSGVGLVVPVINYWWPSFPPKLAKETYRKQPKRDQWKLKLAHYAPRLVNWWMTRKWFPYCFVVQRHPIVFSKRDVESIHNMSQVPFPNEVYLQNNPFIFYFSTISHSILQA